MIALIIDILLLTIIYYFIFVLKTLKETKNLRVEKHHFKYSLGFIICFFFIFVFFIRFLNLFREKIPVNLVIFYNKIVFFDKLNIILFIIFIFFSVKLFIYAFKLNFLKVHYYLMNKNNFSLNESYIDFISFFVTWPNRFILFFLHKNIFFFQFYRLYFYYIFKYLFTFLMLILFFVDIYKNDLILLNFTAFLPFYSFYQILYRLNSFLYFDIEYLFDAIITDVLYCVNYNHAKVYRLYHEYTDIDNSFFTPSKPKGYSIETDEFLIIRNYINKKLLV